jgi:uracil-DNA glycosylase family 4
VSTRRERYLQEMGLGPLWRLRGKERGRTDVPAAMSDPTVRIGAVSAAAVRPNLATPPRSPDHVNSGIANDRAGRILRMDWSELKTAVAACQACGLRKTCKQTVFGVGDERADWMLVGEAPGAEEDARGEPFVGQAGRLLDNMLAAIGLKRDENVYICNVLKCRPPGNRNPEPFEVEQCSPHLLRQLELIQPKLILAMGRFAVRTLLASEASIASLRGRVHRYQGVPLVVTYHPAYLLRNLPDKTKAWEDLCFARRTMAAL